MSYVTHHEPIDGIHVRLKERVSRLSLTFQHGRQVVRRTNLIYE